METDRIYWVPSTSCVLIHEGLMPVSWGKVPAVIATADKGGTQSSADGEGWSWGSSLDRPVPLFSLNPFRWLPFPWSLRSTLCFLSYILSCIIVLKTTAVLLERLQLLV